MYRFARNLPTTELMKLGQMLCVLLLCAIPAGAGENPPRPLKDFRRVVVDKDAPPVERAAATELATYAGRIAGTKIQIVSPVEWQQDAAGLSFFIGDGAAATVTTGKLAPWASEEWLIQSV